MPVHFTLTSASVMSVFFVPQLGSMIYTMNGMATQLNLQADATGTFLGQSSHYNGDGFSDMHSMCVHADRAVRRVGLRRARERANPRYRYYQDLTRQSVDQPPVHLP